MIRLSLNNKLSVILQIILMENSISPVRLWRLGKTPIH